MIKKPALSYAFLLNQILIMSEKIEIEVRYSDDEYIRGMIFSQGESSFYNYLILGVSVLVGFVAVYYLIYRGENIWDFGFLSKLLIGLMIAFPLAYLLKDFRPSQGFFFRRHYDSSPLLQETYKISINDEGINSESKSFSNKLYWSAILKAVQTNEDLHFFVSSNTSLFIPKRVFTDEQQFEIEKLVKRKLDKTARF